jgi:acetyl-CoA carboxylase alpha subunit
MVERVFPEDNGDFERLCGTLRDALAQELKALAALPAEELTERRYMKFRRIGGDGA